MVAIQLKYEILSKNSGNLPKTLHNFKPVVRFNLTFIYRSLGRNPVMFSCTCTFESSSSVFK